MIDSVVIDASIEMAEISEMLAAPADARAIMTLRLLVVKPTK